MLGKLEKKGRRAVRQGRQGLRHAAAPRRRVRLRARPLALHRLSPLRLRLRRGEQPVPRDPQVHWIRVLEMDKEHGVDFEHATPYYDPEKVPRGRPLLHAGAVPAVPRTRPASRSARSRPPGRSPTASWWSTTTGASAAAAACRPAPTAPATSTGASPTCRPTRSTRTPHYLGNRPRPCGVVEKCTFCVQRTRNGRYPACVEICPVGARKFGNLLDPRARSATSSDHKRVFVLKEELNTRPEVLLLLRA